MRLLIFFTLGVLASSAFADQPDPNDALEQWVRTTVENLRKKMPTGIPELGLPPLDPLTIPLIDERIKEGIADVSIQIKDLAVKGLSSFNIKKVKFDLATTELELGIFLPVVTGQSKYKLDGKIASIFPLYGEGNAALHLTDFDLSLKAKVSLSAKPQLSTFDIKMSFSSAQVLFEGLLGGGNLGDLINSVLNMFGKALFDSQRSKIEQMLNGVIRDAANRELQKVDLKDLNIGYSPMAAYSTANANNYVDKVLTNLRPELKKHDPLKLPYARDGFEKKVGFIKFKGYAELQVGWLRGLSTLHRSGDVTLQADPKTSELTLTANLGVVNLQIDYNCKLYFMGIKVYPKLKGTINRVTVYAKISSNLQTKKNELKEFRITNIERPRVQVNSLGPLGYLVSLIANLAMNPIMNGVRGHIEGAVRGLLADAIRNADIPIF